MHVLMVTDAYPPLRTSCAVQMYDLGQAFVEEGHQVTIITPLNGLQEKIRIQHQDGVRLVQVRALKTKDVNYAYRAFAEFINPFLIWNKLKKSPEFLNTKYDGIAWYSPTIFWGPLIKRLKQQFNVKAYLILRDIFPDWALDLGLIKKGLVYKFLKGIEQFQYLQADVIGVQSPNNLRYFKEKNKRLKAVTEVLWNWVGEVKEMPCSIELSKTTLAGRKIFVYAGNMGPAQAVHNLVNFAEAMKEFDNIGFVFVGRGSDVEQLKIQVNRSKLDNCLFFNEIDSTEIPNLFRQCTVGMIALDPRHISHNIPGKFVMYLKYGLPIIGIVNKGNDLTRFVRENKLGVLFEDQLSTSCSSIALDLISELSKNDAMTNRCRKIAQLFFSPKNAENFINKSFR